MHHQVLATLLLALPSLIQAQQLLRAGEEAPLPTAAPLFFRQVIETCAAGQSACTDGGCCDIGAACTSTRGLPICAANCGAGPICTSFMSGLCCKVGYTCNYQSTLCKSNTLGGVSPTTATSVQLTTTTTPRASTSTSVRSTPSSTTSSARTTAISTSSTSTRSSTSVSVADSSASIDGFLDSTTSATGSVSGLGGVTRTSSSAAAATTTRASGGQGKWGVNVVGLLGGLGLGFFGVV